MLSSAMRSILLLFALAAWAAPNRATQWRQDLAFFEHHFTSRHCGPKQMIQFPITWVFPCHQVDFAKLYRPAEFHAEIAELESHVADLSDADITLRLMKLVAAAHVGHTYVGAPLFAPFHRIPIGFTWYGSDLAVTSAAPEYSAALGARVLRVGSLDASALLAGVAPYVSYENDAWLRLASPNLMSLVEVLQAAGAVPAGQTNVEFTLARPGGEPFTVSAAPGNPKAWKTVNVDVPATLARKNPRAFYWYEYLANSKTLYIQYNRCANDPKQHFGDFARGVLSFADAHPVDRTVIDLRFNGGGNSFIIRSLKNGIKARPALASHLFVLIGAGTFSSAQDNAIELRRELHATLVGGATGERPNGYGEVKWFRLPNSKLFVQYSTRYHRLMKDADPPALEPDIRATRTFDDAMAGRDPVLDAALRAKT